MAIALKMLRRLWCPDFLDTKATEKFLLILDEIFDWLNCQSCSGLGSKAPLTKERLPELRDILAKCKDLLLPMCGIHGNTIVKTKRYVGIMGLLCAGQSLVAIAEELLDLPGFRFFLSYRLSQDSLELLFNGIRRAGNGIDMYALIYVV